MMLHESDELTDYDAGLTEIVQEESILGTSLDGYAYVNAAGDSRQYIPDTMTADTPLLLEKGGYSIGIAPVAAEEQKESVLSIEAEEDMAAWQD